MKLRRADHNNIFLAYHIENILDLIRTGFLYCLFYIISRLKLINFIYSIAIGSVKPP